MVHHGFVDLDHRSRIFWCQSATAPRSDSPLPPEKQSTTFPRPRPAGSGSTSGPNSSRSCCRTRAISAVVVDLVDDHRAAQAAFGGAFHHPPGAVFDAGIGIDHHRDRFPPPPARTAPGRGNPDSRAYPRGSHGCRRGRCWRSRRRWNARVPSRSDRNRTRCCRVRCCLPHGARRRPAAGLRTRLFCRRQGGPQGHVARSDGSVGHDRSLLRVRMDVASWLSACAGAWALGGRSWREATSRATRRGNGPGRCRAGKRRMATPARFQHGFTGPPRGFACAIPGARTIHTKRLSPRCSRHRPRRRQRKPRLNAVPWPKQRLAAIPPTRGRGYAQPAKRRLLRHMPAWFASRSVVGSGYGNGAGRRDAATARATAATRRRLRPVRQRLLRPVRQLPPQRFRRQRLLRPVRQLPPRQRQQQHRPHRGDRGHGIAGAVLGSKIGSGTGSVAASAIGTMVGGMAGRRLRQRAPPAAHRDRQRLRSGAGERLLRRREQRGHRLRRDL